MGNSLRSTFGNLCGVQASKDVATIDDQKPVAKPKEHKKKDKKTKKSKKLNNGNLTEIEEESGVPNDQCLTKNDSNKNKSQDQSEEPTGSIESESKGSLTLKEQAKSISQSTVDNELDNEENDNDDDISDVIKDHYDDDDDAIVDSIGRKSTDSEKGIEQPDLKRGVISNTPSKSSIEDAPSDFDIERKFLSIHQVEEVVPEELCIGYADKLFVEAARVYGIFVEKNSNFKKSVLEFENSVEPDKKFPDFEKCWKLYTKLLDQENKRTVSEGAKHSTSMSEVDICDINVNLQEIRLTGTELIRVIDRVRAEFEKCVTEAGTVDVIEYVKGKMIEGEQLGITSKFSAPGKYRRNMKQLKNALKLLNNVESDSKDILSSVESRLGRVSKPKQVPVEEEPDVIPVMRSDVINDDIFANLEFELRLDGESNTHSEGSTRLMDLVHEAEQNRNIQHQEIQRPLTPTSVDQDYVIETIPERSPHSTVSPLVKTNNEKRPTSPVTQVIIEEEDHNTLDFGKYVFIDPSTGDIQVMRNRSRSLDSLVSMVSNRSSISRFGSFEFVTDFEINIAEKNQQLKK